MPCLCGDLACSSCGPAQGANPAWEAVVDEACERWPVLVDLLDEHDDLNDVLQWFAGKGAEDALASAAEADAMAAAHR